MRYINYTGQDTGQDLENRDDDSDHHHLPLGLSFRLSHARQKNHSQECCKTKEIPGIKRQKEEMVGA
jgi:hypothetical protein